MKKILALLMSAALLFSLGGAAALADDAAEIPGVYSLAALDDGSGEDTGALLSAMAAMGMTATLTVEEDGSAVLDMFGETMELQFDFAAGTVGVEDDVLSYSYADESLSFGDEEMSFTFTKGEPEPPKAGRGTYDLFTLVSLMDEAGNDMAEQLAAMEETGLAATLKLFEDGAGELDLFGETQEIRFDFETMTATAQGESEPFTLEDHYLVLTDGSGKTLGFRQEDPGFVGSYVMTGMTSDEEDLSEELAMLGALGMLPTLTVDENNLGVMDMFGETTELVFDPEAGTVTSDGESSAYTYDYGHLAILSEDGNLLFARVLPVEEAEG